MDMRLFGRSSTAQPTNCVVCFRNITSDGDRRFCKELLNNSNVGDFLVKLDVVPAGEISLNAPICRQCLHFVSAADKAWSIVDDSVAMLKERRDARREESGNGVGNGYASTTIAPETKLSSVMDRKIRASSVKGVTQVAAESRQRNSSARVPTAAPLSPRELAVKSAHQNGSEDTKLGKRKKETKAELPAAPYGDLWCHICSRPFAKLKYLKAHDKKFHEEPTKQTAEKPYPNPIGLAHQTIPLGWAKRDSVFDKSSNHAKPNTDENKDKKIVKCKICQKLVRRSGLAKHVGKMHRSTAKGATSTSGAGKRHECHECDYATDRTDHFKRHVRNKHPSVSVVAAPAPAPKKSLTKRQAALESKKKTKEETGDEPNSNRLRILSAESVETAASKYNCRFCGEAFFTVFSFKAHVAKEHAGMSLDAEEPKDEVVVLSQASGTQLTELMFPCPDCHKVYKKKIDRLIHIKACHKDACTCCGDLYKSHVEEDQKEGVCDVCSVQVDHVNAHGVWAHKAKYCKTCFGAFSGPSPLTAHEASCGKSGSTKEQDDEVEEVDGGEEEDEGFAPSWPNKNINLNGDDHGVVSGEPRSLRM